MHHEFTQSWTNIWNVYIKITNKNKIQVDKIVEVSGGRRTVQWQLYLLKNYKCDTVWQIISNVQKYSTTMSIPV